MGIKTYGGLAAANVKAVNAIVSASFSKDNNLLNLKNQWLTSWKTDNAGTTSSTQIRIPTVPAGVYNCQVDWGDGIKQLITTAADANWTHTYSSAGTYSVTVSGIFRGIQFANSGDRLKPLTLSQWGSTFRLGTSETDHFHGCGNLVITATDILNLQGTTTLQNTFRAMSALTTIPSFNSWNFASITSCRATFFNNLLFNQALTFTALALTTTQSMISTCAAFNSAVNITTSTALINISLMMAYNVLYNSPFTISNTSAVTDCTNLFNGDSKFNQPLTGITSLASATSLSGFLQACFDFNQIVNLVTGSALTTIINMMRDAQKYNSAFTLSNTTNLASCATAFYNAFLFNQPMTGIPSTANVTTMSFTFGFAAAFDQDVSFFSIAALTTAANMLNGSGFTKVNYDKLLDSATGWPSQATISNSVALHAGTAHYSAGNPTTGRATLVSTKSWTITDGGTP